MSKEIRYSVLFVKKGFYSEYQPKYNWSFTDDFDKAKKYKTIIGALNRAGYADTTISYSNFKHQIVIEEIDSVIKDGVSVITKTIVGELDIREERDKILKKRLITLKKKYPVSTEPLNVKVIKSSIDDPFWD